MKKIFIPCCILYMIAAVILIGSFHYTSLAKHEASVILAMTISLSHQGAITEAEAASVRSMVERQPIYMHPTIALERLQRMRVVLSSTQNSQSK